MKLSRVRKELIERWIAEGHDEVKLGTLITVNFTEGAPRDAALGYLNELRAKKPARKTPDPIATPEQAREAYERLRSQRKAATELGISSTHLRRLAGLDD